MRALAQCLALVLFAACKEDKPAPAPSSKPSTVASASASVIGSAMASTMASTLASAMASGSAAPAEKTCEVEIFGSVKGAPAKARLVVYVAQNDCLADDAQILGHLDLLQTDPNSKDPPKYMIEVFPKWGTDVTICAAAYIDNATTTEHFGKAKGKFHAEAEGEVTFNEVVIELTKGKAKAFPKDWDKSAGAQHPSGKVQGPPKQ